MAFERLKQFRPIFNLKYLFMNQAQIHLALNHAPLFLALIGGIILLVGMIRKNQSLMTISLYLLVGAAISVLPVYFTGEGTEELVENLPGVQEGMIEEHEEAAGLTLIILIITGIGALAALIFSKRKLLARPLLWLSLILSLASFGSMIRTAHLGGLIRHSEIGSGVQSGVEKEDKEDDD